MRIVSGIQPSGALHIGNYLGAIKQFVALQEEHEGFYFVADLHALTENPKPEEIKKRTFDAVVDYLALGLNPKKATLFVQSDVPQHTELSWIFTTTTPVGDLERMTQYKDKTRQFAPSTKLRTGKKGVNAGLLMYPVLMAADILLYKAERVPTGEDQKQHLELARSIAKRFNTKYGKLFPEPKSIMPKAGARIMSLQEPKKKMSKSHNPDSAIGLFEEADDIKRKIAKAVTDSGREIAYDPIGKPAIANLLTIFSLFSGKTTKELETYFIGKGYAPFKQELTDLLVTQLGAFRERRHALAGNAEHIKSVLEQGASHARDIARQTLTQVRERIGIE